MTDKAWARRQGLRQERMLKPEADKEESIEAVVNEMTLEVLEGETIH